MMEKIKLGLLDFGYRKGNSSSADIFNDVLEYATLADQSGFTSFWLGEHHNGSKAWSNPEMIIPLIAGLTDHIRVGVAGILLAAHSPYRVALNFKLLSNIFPERIDLGLANGNPPVHIVRKLLSNDDIDENYMQNFNSKTEELLKYFGDEVPLYEAEKITIPPFKGQIPRLWKLGVSFNGLNDCISKKMNFCKSLFHTKIELDHSVTKEQIINFRESYFQTNQMQPEISIAFAGICDLNQKTAEKTFSDLGFDNKEWAANSIVGSPSFFKEKIHELYEKYNITQFVFYDRAIEFKNRMKAIELLTKEFQLA